MPDEVAHRAESVAIWKYPLSMTSGNYEIAMPAGAAILAVQAQHDVPCIWALVNPALPTEIRRFVMVATGQPFSMNGVTGQHVGTFQLMGGSFVAHLFELARIDGEVAP